MGMKIRKPVAEKATPTIKELQLLSESEGQEVFDQRPVRVPFTYVNPELIDPKTRREILAKLGIDSWAPVHKTAGAACVDYRAAVTVTIPPGRVRPIPTGIKVALPPGYELSARARSGLFISNQVFVLGTIDDDYRGEIKVLLANFGDSDFKVDFGDRIAQFKLSRYTKQEYIEVESLDETSRGTGGLGHTGVK